MEEESVLGQASFTTMPVARIVHDGMANRRHVHPDLMGASRVELQSQQRHGVRLVNAGQDFVTGSSGPSIGAYRHHGRRTCRTSDRRVDDAALFGNVPLDHAQVRALHQPFSQLGAQVQEPLGRLCDHQHARRALVEPMHDSGT